MPVPEDAKIALRFNKQQYFLGENVAAEFCVENTGRGIFYIDLGGDYRGASRSLRFHVKATDDKGMEVADPDPSPFCMGGLSATSKLEPGTKHCETIPLLRYCRFERPGVYRVRVSHDLGWTATATSPLSGYSYVPVSQTGPDQFYELVGQSKWADHTTLSALLMFYPLPLLQAAPPRRSVDRAIWGGFGVGFGPTFWRGAGAEAFKQWNLRISIAELYPGLVFSMGPSWRTYDRALMANTVVSVPKPATAPSTFQTTPDSDVEFSLGLSVDLSLIASGISTVAGAIIPSSATVTPPPKSTP